MIGKRSNMNLTEARRRKASPLRFRHSQSLASLLHLPNHAKVRSTTHRFGKTTKPLAWQGNRVKVFMQ